MGKATIVKTYNPAQRRGRGRAWNDKHVSALRDLLAAHGGKVRNVPDGTVLAFAARLGRTPGAIRAKLYEVAPPGKYKHYSARETAKIVSMRQQGASARQIADEIGRDVQSVRNKMLSLYGTSRNTKRRSARPMKAEPRRQHSRNVVDRFWSWWHGRAA